MKNHSWACSALAVSVSVFMLVSCSPAPEPEGAPPYDFVFDPLIPALPDAGPIDPVVVIPADLDGFSGSQTAVRRDIGRRIEGPLSESEILRLQEEARSMPVNERIQTFLDGAHFAPTPGVGFESLDHATSGANFVPPDPELAVGPNHIVAVVNDSIEVYDRAGNSLLAPMLFSTFFGGISGCSNLFDPNVLYDEQLDRFVVGIDANANGYCVAMSQTPNPTLAWWAYGFATAGPTFFFDYPHAGCGEHAIYMGANIYNNPPTTFVGADVWAIDKHAMAVGAPLPMPIRQPIANAFTPQPMNAHGWAQGTWPVASPHVILANQYLFGPPPVYSGDLIEVWSWFDPFGVSSFGAVGTVDLAIATGITATYPLDAPQLAGPNIQANDWRVLDAEFRNGDVWTTQTISCNPGGGTVDCIRWAEIDPTTPAVRQAGVIGTNNDYRLYPDVGVNHCDDMTIGYTKISPLGPFPHGHPDVWVTGRLGTDPLGSVQTETPVRIGDLPYVPSDPPPVRWGDYTGGTSDPDGVGTWYLGEYSKLINPPTAANWGTYVGEFTTNCGVDLAVIKDDGVTQVNAGGPVNYTIVVTNMGRGDAVGAIVTDTFPAALTGVTWTCSGQTGPPTSTCFSPSGSGNINLGVNLQAGSQIIISASGSLNVAATGTLVNTASASVVGIVDPVPGNDSATDTDTIIAAADLDVDVTDGACYVLPGGSVTYTVTVDNNGPANASAASVTDSAPAILTVNSWTCAASGAATCGSASGTGALSDTPSLTAGDGVTYTVSGTVSAAATGELVYTVSAFPGAGMFDPNSSNDSDADVNALELPILCDGFEDGTTNAWFRVVP